MKFWSAPDSVDGKKIEIAARLSSVGLDKVSTPNKKEVALQISENVKISDVQASLIYLSRNSEIYPTESQVLIDSWLEVAETHYKVPLALWTSPYFNSAAKGEVIAAASKDAKGLLKELDLSLKKSKFLAGDFFSLADISLGSELFYPFSLVIDENTQKGFKSVVEWIQRVAEVEAFKQVWGEFKLCGAAAAVPGSVVAKEEKKAEVKKAQPKKEKKPKDQVVINKEEQERIQRERKEKKEREQKAKEEAERLKKEQESKEAKVE